MQGGLEFVSPQKLCRWLLVVVLAVAVLPGAMTMLIRGAASAQNLDQGKTAAKLFADSCAECHRSARGLAKDRFRLTLYLFLQDHYASNSSSAWALASYLASVEDQPRGRSGTATARSSATRTSESSLRPPLSVPVR